MVDKNKFVRSVKHKKGRDELQAEETKVKAYMLDDDEYDNRSKDLGIACSIGFHEGMIGKTDYFLMESNRVLLIELSDLKEDISECEAYINSKITTQMPAKEKKKIQKMGWLSIQSEFSKKWCGSIAVIERFCRKTNALEKNVDPIYQLLIVCRDGTDIRMLDALKTRLFGMMKEVKVCNTKDLNSELLGSIGFKTL